MVMLKTEDAHRAGVEPQMLALDRRQLDPPGGEDAVEVTVPHHDHVAALQGIGDPRQHPVGPGRHLVDALAAGHVAGPDRPLRLVLPDLSGRPTLELAVLPLGQVSVDLDIGQSDHLGRPAGATLGAGQHQRRPQPAERRCQLTGLLLAYGGEVDIRTTGVLLVAAPLGLAVPQQ